MSDIIAYKLNGEIYDTQSIGEHTSEAQPIYFDNSEDALKVIRHSCAHLLAQAVRELYPSAKFFVGPAIEDGFYYDIRVSKDNGEKLGEEDLGAIEKKMRALAEANLEIKKIALKSTLRCSKKPRSAITESSEPR